MRFLVLLLLISLNTYATDITGDWHGKLDIQGTKLRISFHIDYIDEKYISTMDSPDQNAKGLPTTSTHFDGDNIEIKIKNMGVTFKGRYEKEKIIGTFSQGGKSLPLELTKAVVAVKKQEPRYQEPIKPYPYLSEEVSFINSKANNIKLVGTLTLPVNVNKPPVAILISGSGPQNRDSELKAFNQKPFLVLSDYLTRHGIAVLRYDDRGVAQSEGIHINATSMDFASDTQAAIDYLKTRSDSINVDKIGLIGHSEGGLIAPMVAANNKDVAFIVLLAGLGIDGAQILLTQTKKAAELAGTNTEEINFSHAVSEKLFKIVQSEPNLQELSKKVITFLKEEKTKHSTTLSKHFSDEKIQEVAKSVSSPWMSYFIRTNPDDYLSHVNCPTLAINGELDFQVVPKLNLNGIKQSLKTADNNDVTIKELKGLNHLFQTAKTGASNEYGEIEETISPIVLKLLTKWINNRFSSK